MDWFTFNIKSLIFVVLFGLVWLINLPRAYRSRQMTCLKLAVLLSLIVVVLRYKYEQLLVVYFAQLKAFLPPDLPIVKYDLGLFLGIVLVVFFLLSKTVIILWKFIFRHAPARPTRAYCFELDRGICLKSSWDFPARFFFHLYSLMFFAFLVLIGLSEHSTGYPFFLPPTEISIISLLLCSEIALYLRGLRPAPGVGKLLGEDSLSQQKGHFAVLLDIYKNTWPDKILAIDENIALEKLPWATPAAETHVSATDHLSPSLQFVQNNLYGQNLRLTTTQLRALKDVWLRKDLLLIDPGLTASEPLIGACLQRHIVEGRNVVVLARTFRSTSRVWLHNILGLPFYAAAPFKISTLRDSDRDQELIFTTVNEIIEFPLENIREWLSDVGAVVVLDPIHTIFNDISSAHALISTLDDCSYHPLQLLFVTRDDPVNLESAVREFLNAEPQEYRLHSYPAQEGCYIAWKTEGEISFQEKVLPGQRRHFGVEQMIAIPALQNGVEKIYLKGQAKTPWREYIEEFDKTELLRVGKLKDLLVANSGEMAPIQDKRTLVIARDQDHNLPATLKRALVHGSEGAFAQTVSEPYLLRDYLAENIGFFLGYRSEITANLAPILNYNTTSTIYSLAERLLVSALPEKTIRFALSDVSAAFNNRSNSDFLHQFSQGMKEVLGLKEAVQLNVVEGYCFDVSQNCFRIERMISLAPQSIGAISEKWRNFYSICDSEGTILDIMHQGHISQKYLPEQIWNLQGEPYRLKPPNPVTKKIEAIHIPAAGSVVYRNQKAIRFDPAKTIWQERKQYENRQVKSVWTLGEADFEITTTGYFSYFHRVDFNSRGFQRVDLADKKLLRHYASGRLLSLTISLDRFEFSAESKKQLAPALTLLLNEIFVSVFPETYHFICAATINSPEVSLSNQVQKLLPDLIIDSPPSRVDDEITIYLFEDSMTDMGLVQAFYEYGDNTLSLLDDYLFWVLQKQQQADFYLKFGYPEVPDWLHLEELSQLVEALTEHLPITTRSARQSYLKNKDSQPYLSAGNETCDFCGKKLSLASFEQLSDGRVRCTECKDAAISQTEDFKEVLQDTRSWLTRTFNLKLRQTVDIHFTNTRVIHGITGEVFIPTSNYDPRAVGLAVRSGGGYSVYIENGAPDYLVISTVAHELTHIWQYDNLDYKQMEKDYGLLLIEGMSVWVGMEILKSKKIAAEYCAMESQRSDVYGQGYRMVAAMVRDSGGQSPFEIMKRMYS